MGIRASIVVPTLNRKRLLMELLDSLAVQTLPRSQFEVVVIDNGSSDGTAEAFEAFARQQEGLQLTFYRMPFNGGPVVSRNHGAKLAQGAVLFFTDSDVVVGRDWLELGLEPFDGDPKMAMVSGPTVDKPNQPQKFFSVGTGNRYDENPIFPTSNVIYRREVFEKLGGFDPATSAGDMAGVAVECSDVDMAWQVIDAGYHTQFLPNLIVHHEVRVETAVRWLATQTRVFYIPMIVRRHPSVRQSLLWFGPFAAPENLYFYIAVAATILALYTGSPWWMLGLIPLFARFFPFLRPSWAPLSWPKLVAQFMMILVRQTLICGLLVCGSFRSRQIVL